MTKKSLEKTTESLFKPKKSETVLFAVILCLGILLRLPFISYPSQVVFDEVGFGKLVTAYGWTHERLFDIHPPHGKLLITAGAFLGGYKGTIDYTRIGTPCAESIAPLRFVPALAGGLIPLVVFMLLRQLGASLSAAFLGGVMMVFDNAFTVQSRVIGLDSLLIFFILSSLSALLAAGTCQGKPRIGFMLLAGMLTGLSVGTKFTGLAAAGLAGVIMLDNLWMEKTARHRWTALGHAALFAGAAAFVYLLGWKIHFLLMRLPGEGDAFFVPAAGFLKDTFKLHGIMLSANAGITAQHPYSSLWWQWLIMNKPIFYWVHNDAGIYFIGNPMVWWLSGVVFFWLLGYLIFGRARYPQGELVVDRISLLWIPLAGYLISIIPLVPVKRPLFLYHYLPALTFSLIAGILWIDSLGLMKNISFGYHPVSLPNGEAGNGKRRIWPSIGYSTVIGCCVVVYGLLSPITYGFPPLSSYQAMLGWIGFGP
jgi:dolichyl-phosphate-mannose-protein mannosyltransferase